MVRLVSALLVALLTACDRSSDEAPPAPAPVPRQAGPPQQLSAADAERMLQEKALAGLRAILPDPKDARFSELRAGTAGAVCGRIDTEQPDGKRSGFRPFVVTPEGVGVISLTNQLMLNDPEDLFPDYYIQWCATPAELATLKISGDVNLMATAPEIPSDLPGQAELPVPAPETPAAAGPPPAPAPVPQPRPGAASSSELESFSKVVLRNQSSGKE